MGPSITSAIRFAGSRTPDCDRWLGARLLHRGRRLPGPAQLAHPGGRDARCRAACLAWRPCASSSAVLRHARGTRTSAAELSRASSAMPRCRRASCPCWAWVARCRTASWLRDGRLDVAWEIDRSRATSSGCARRRQQLAAALGAEFQRQPDLAHRPAGHHRPSARRRADGSRRAARASSTRWGRVFGHPGLYVADGSVMPGTGRAEPEPHDRGARRPRSRTASSRSQRRCAGMSELDAEAAA